MGFDRIRSGIGGKFDQLLRSTEVMDSLLTSDAYSVGVRFEFDGRFRGSRRHTRFPRF